MNKLRSILVMCFLLSFTLFSTNATAQVKSKTTKTYAKDNVKETDVKTNRKKAKSFKNRFKSNRPQAQPKQQVNKTTNTKQVEQQALNKERKEAIKREYKESLTTSANIERAKDTLIQQQQNGTISEEEIVLRRNLIRDAEKRMKKGKNKRM